LLRKEIKEGRLWEERRAEEMNQETILPGGEDRVQLLGSEES
jgi:hypothetical protein